MRQAEGLLVNASRNLHGVTYLSLTVRVRATTRPCGQPSKRKRGGEIALIGREVESVDL